MNKEETLIKIKETKRKIVQEKSIEEIIKDINDILEYFKQDEVWIEYSKLNVLFMETFNTCLLATNNGDDNNE